MEPFYASLIGFELVIEHAIDLVQLKDPLLGQDLVNNHLTALIKTFERPALLDRLLISIRNKYPHLHIIVVDDSRSARQIDGIETIIMPFDSGVSAGRNTGLSHVNTKYVLILDDDFIFYRNTNLEAAISAIEKYPQVDIMGGEVIYLPLYHKSIYSNGGNLHPTKAKATMPKGSFIGDLPVYDKVANFYIAKTDRIRLVGWDSSIKRLDHADFFTRAKGVLTTVFNPHMKCLHAQNPFDRFYMEKRNDFAADNKILHSKYHKTYRE